MTWEQQKAKELFEFHRHGGDVSDITAKESAIFTAKEIREETKKVYLTYKNSCVGTKTVYQEKWNKVIKEIEKL